MTDVEVQARGEEYKQNAEKALEQAAQLQAISIRPLGF